MKKLSFEEMEVVEGRFGLGDIFPNNPCEVALGMAAGVWAAAISVAFTPFAGTVFAFVANTAANKACKGGGSWFN